MSKLAVVLAIAAAGACASPKPKPQPHWVATWAASPQAADPDAPVALDGRTVRQIVHVSAGGARVRVRLSNAYGKAPLAIDAAHVALRDPGASSAIRAGSDRALTFAGGAAAIAIPAGSDAVSDPVALDVPAGADLAISLYLRGPAAASTVHGFANTTGYIAPGDVTAATELPAAAATTPMWHALAGVDVDAPAATCAVVAFGDSLVDGMHATPGANHRWTDRLAERVAAAGRARAVVGAGILGNQLLDELIGAPGVKRLDRDVLAQPGVCTAIVAIGVNDVGVYDGGALDPTVAQRLIAGYRDVIARAHARGLRVLGATIAPFAGTPMYSPAGDAARATVNEWIRTAHAYDGVIDFDAVLRDPDHPERLRADLDSGDHIHPTDAGYRAMSDAIPLELL